MKCAGTDLTVLILACYDIVSCYTVKREITGFKNKIRAIQNISKVSYSFRYHTRHCYCWWRCDSYNNVCGGKIIPYFTEGYEGFDINDELDWILAEELVKRGLVKLPEMKK